MFVFLAAISPFYLFGLGLLITTALRLNRSLIESLDVPSAWRALVIVFICGISANFALALAIPDFLIASFVGLALAVVGCIVGIKTAWALVQTAFADRTKCAVFAGLLVLLAARTFMHPLSAWDARSIWFFHAKFFFYNRSTYSSVGWMNPSYSFSHRDYPALVSALAAQLASIAGFWNEYLPKISSWLCVLPFIALQASYAEKKWSYILLFLFQFCLVAKFIDNGLMDGLLALCAGFSLLIFVQGVWRRTDLLLAACLLAMSVGLKNEARLIILCVALALISDRLLQKKISTLFDRRFLAPLALFGLLALPSVYWSFHVKQMGLVNDLNIGSASIPFVVDRILHPYWIWRIFWFLFLRTKLIYWPLILMLFRKAETVFEIEAPNTRPLILFCVLYAAGLFAIYLATPHDLEWHLSTSYARTSLPLTLSLIGLAYLRLKTIEVSNERHFSLDTHHN